MSQQNTVKVVLVGSYFTGKTSLINRYVDEEFTNNVKPSTQPSFHTKAITVDNATINLEIWDTAGQERYHSLTSLFYQEADYGIVVFDLTNRESFLKAKDWAEELRREVSDDFTISLAGNKMDLKDKICVPFEEISFLAKEINAEPFEVSAKTGENVDLLFNLVKKIYKTRKAKQGTQIAIQSDNSECKC